MWFSLLVAFLLFASSGPASSQPKRASDLLMRTTVRLEITNTADGQAATCLGMVYRMLNGIDAAIVTAKHCFEDIASVPLRDRWRLSGYGLKIRVIYSDGTTVDDVLQLAWSNQGDLAMLVVSVEDHPELAHRNFHDICPHCRVYLNFGLRQHYPVLSVLSAGGGEPVISSGFVDISDDPGEPKITLPAAPGTSGAPIVDRSGNLVAIVTAGLVMKGTDATPRVAGFYMGRGVDELANFVDLVPVQVVLHSPVSKFCDDPNFHLTAAPAPPAMSPQGCGGRSVGEDSSSFR